MTRQAVSFKFSTQSLITTPIAASTDCKLKTASTLILKVPRGGGHHFFLTFSEYKTLMLRNLLQIMLAFAHLS
jgi:hypothetical protein